MASAGLTVLVILAALTVPLVNHGHNVIKQYRTPIKTELPKTIKRVEAKGFMNVEFYNSPNAHYEHARFGGFREDPYTFKVENDTLYITSREAGYEVHSIYFGANGDPQTISTATVRVYLPHLESVLLDGSDSLYFNGPKNVELITNSQHHSRFVSMGTIDNLKATIVPYGNLFLNGNGIKMADINYQDSFSGSLDIDRAGSINITIHNKDKLCHVISPEGTTVTPMVNVREFTKLTLNGKDVTMMGKQPLEQNTTKNAPACLSFRNPATTQE
jgi:hypothetical protein